MAKQPLIYLDYAAATPIDTSVVAAMQPYFSDLYFNPSATYTPARIVKKNLETARNTVGHWLGAKPSEIQFTAGGTEANNIAIHGIMSRFPAANIVTSAVEHDAVRGPATRYDSTVVGVGTDGRVELAAVKAAIDDNTVLISVMYANHEVGSIQPIRDLGRLIKEIRKQRQSKGNKLPIYLHTDACQAANYLDLHVTRLGVDLMTLNGGKLYGPKQSGVLYVRAGVELAPLLQGGGQEHGMRPGTENVAASVGFAAALELAQSTRSSETKRLQGLQKEFITKLTTKNPKIVLNGPATLRLPNNIHITIPGIDNERLLVQLDEAGVLAAAGSACTASSQEPSHVLKAMGLTDSEAQSSIRFSLGRHTKQTDIEETIKILQRLITLK